jgi:hypothetical protein
MKLPACASRHTLPGNPSQFFCSHPRVSVTNSLVTEDICRPCPFSQSTPERPRKLPESLRQRLSEPCFYLVEKVLDDSGRFTCRHSAHVTTTVEECRCCSDFAPGLLDKQVRSWCVGVTTAPRREPTLETTLGSLHAAGWSDVRLFAEPHSEVPSGTEDLFITRRAELLGAFSNWYLGLAELVMRSPDADAYFLCQDDIVLCQNLRGYLEERLWPARAVGVVSVYCAAWQDHFGTVGFHQLDAGWHSCGALAYVFSNAGAKALLTHPLFLQHRTHGPESGGASIDSVVGQWCRMSGLPYYVHSPSLVQHVGRTSALWRRDGDSVRRHASSFLGEERDALQWWEDRVSIDLERES